MWDESEYLVRLNDLQISTEVLKERALEADKKAVGAHRNKIFALTVRLILYPVIIIVPIVLQDWLTLAVVLSILLRDLVILFDSIEDEHLSNLANFQMMFQRNVENIQAASADLAVATTEEEESYDDAE